MAHFFGNGTKVEIPSEIKPPLAKLCWRFILKPGMKIHMCKKHLQKIELGIFEISGRPINNLSLNFSLDHDHDFLIQKEHFHEKFNFKTHHL